MGRKKNDSQSRIDALGNDLVVRPKCDNSGYALAYAIKKAGSTVPSEMAKVLRSADNLRSATGNMWFSKDGDRVMDNIFIKMVEDWQFKYLSPESNDEEQMSDAGGQN